MTNDSATGGYIQPITGGPAPLEDDALAIFLQNLIANLTTLPGKLIFLRWQVDPPNWPSTSTNWATVGITTQDSGYNYDGHDPVLINPPENYTPPPTGYDITIEQQDVELLVSFFGPNAMTNCGLMRSNLQVAQNRELLVENGFGFKSVGKIFQLPEMINQNWYRRVDTTVQFKREIIRYYPIRDINSAEVTLQSDTGVTETINIEQ